jgi:hypothetical protein
MSTTLQRYEDRTFTPAQKAKIRLIEHELSITHPTLPPSFAALIAQVGAVCTEEEMAAMVAGMEEAPPEK